MERIATFVALRNRLRWLGFAVASGLLVFLSTGCSPEARQQRLLEKADASFEELKLEEARIQYLTLLREDPENARAIQQIGLIWSKQGSPIRALPFLAKAAELDPENVEVRKNLAQAYLSISQVDAGIKEARLVLGSSSHGRRSAPVVGKSPARAKKERLKSRKGCRNSIRKRAWLFTSRRHCSRQGKGIWIPLNHPFKEQCRSILNQSLPTRPWRISSARRAKRTRLAMH